MPNGRHDKMLGHLAATMIAARRARRLDPVDVALLAGVDASTIVRFERGRAWPRQPDVLVGAYAEALGVPAVQLWSAAVRRWEDARGQSAPPTPR